MPAAHSDAVVPTAARPTLADVPPLSAAMLDRMHVLLERNTDAPLVGVERDELDGLVALALSEQVSRMRD